MISHTANVIAPKYNGLPGGDVNMEDEAVRWIAENPDAAKATAPRSPLLDPATCQRMMDGVHLRMGYVLSWGGYREKRKTLWAGSYMEKRQNFVHMGVDVNVPAGTPLRLLEDAVLLHVDDDDDPQGGWGPRMIFRLVNRKKPIGLILAHLENIRFETRGTLLRAGTEVAAVGRAPRNGNWFAHAHGQAIGEEFLQELESDNFRHAHDRFDAYYCDAEVDGASVLFPDPTELLGLPRKAA